MHVREHIQLFNSIVVADIIQCIYRFSRLIVAQSNRDFSLNGSLFQLYGMSTTGGEL